MGHVRLKRSDPRFWGESRPLHVPSSHSLTDVPFTQPTDYNIKELALYDLPAMVDHVRRETGYDKVRLLPLFFSLLLLTSHLQPDRFHWSLSGERNHVLFTCSRNGTRIRREVINLHRSRPSSLCWSLDYWIPLWCAEEYEVEDLEEMVWYVASLSLSFAGEG